MPQKLTASDMTALRLFEPERDRPLDLFGIGMAHLYYVRMMCTLPQQENLSQVSSFRVSEADDEEEVATAKK